MAQITPQTPEWVDQAPVQIVEVYEFQTTPAAVWSALADNEGWVRWFPGFREAKFTTAVPPGIDAVRFVHQDQFKVEETITRWSPDEAWSMTVTAINIPVITAMAENVNLTSNGDSTQLTWHIGVQTAWWARPIRRALAAKSRRALKKALEQLDTIVTETHHERRSQPLPHSLDQPSAR